MPFCILPLQSFLSPAATSDLSSDILQEWGFEDLHVQRTQDVLSLLLLYFLEQEAQAVIFPHYKKCKSHGFPYLHEVYENSYFWKGLVLNGKGGVLSAQTTEAMRSLVLPHACLTSVLCSLFPPFSFSFFTLLPSTSFSLSLKRKMCVCL